MNTCQHLVKIGDNYGMSCRGCGEQLSGFGYGGFFGSRLNGTEVCIHLWAPLGDESATHEVCIFCEQTREKVTL